MLHMLAELCQHAAHVLHFVVLIACPAAGAGNEGVQKDKRQSECQYHEPQHYVPTYHVFPDASRKYLSCQALFIVVGTHKQQVRVESGRQRFFFLYLCLLSR